MAQIGNAENAKLNSEWGKHVKKRYSRLTSKLRRINDKKIIKENIDN